MHLLRLLLQRGHALLGLVARIIARIRTSLYMPGAPVAPAAAPNENGAAAAGAAAAGAPKAEDVLAAEVLVREADAGAPQVSVFVLLC